LDPGHGAFDLGAYAVKAADGDPVAGMRAELMARLNQYTSAYAAGWAQYQRAWEYGGEAGLRLKW